MNKEVFLQYKDKHIQIVLKPKGFILDGYILDFFDDCFAFKTREKVGYFEYDTIMSLTSLE
jgi:hypothetical protein